MTLIEEKTLADHDINVRSTRQELQLLEEQLKKHGRNELQHSPSVTADTDTITKRSLLDRNGCHVGVEMKYPDVKETVKSLPSSPTVTADPDTISRPKGQWIPCTKNGLPLSEMAYREGQKWYGYKCSNCNFIYKGNALTESPYCQKCGTDMRP